MSNLTFYRAPMSTASVTELVLEELGIPHETVTVDIRNGGNKKPEYLEINPNGKVPTIVHDGTTLWESSAITLYLGETFGVDKKLWPAAGTKRGEAMKWVVWSNVTFADAITRRNTKLGENGQRDMERCLDILNDGLEGKTFLLGDYSLVDAHIGSFMGWLRHFQVDLSPWKNVAAWSKRCDERPAAQRLFARANA